MAISQLMNNNANQSLLAANRANLSTATVNPAGTGSSPVGTVNVAPANNFAANVNFTGGLSNAGLNPNVLGSLVALLTALLQQIQSGGGLGNNNPQGQGNMNGNTYCGRCC